MPIGLEESSWSSPDLKVTDGIVKSLGEPLKLFTEYLSSYIHILNKFISHLRRVATLRFERTTLIKYVKKLRFFNDVLLEYKLERLYDYNSSPNALKNGIKPITLYFEKILECLDLMNFYLTQSLQKEIISKTLNTNLTFSDSSIASIDDTYNHFVKYTQWMVESLGSTDDLFQLEVIKFALKCAEEDGTDLEETDNIFLQEVIAVEDEEEYSTLTYQWTQVLDEKLNILNTEYDQLADQWHDKFGKTKT